MSETTRNDWGVQLLGELAESRRGITYSSAMLESQDEGLPYVNMKSFLKGGGFNSDGTKRYAGIYGQNDLVGERDLLIANTDVTAGDIVGVPALLPNELSANKVLYSHHVTRLRLTSWVTVPFLYYLLCLPEYRSHMLRIARGTTVLMLDMHAIKRIPIRAPKTKAEQDRIAKILSTLDEAIAQTEALIAKHQQIKAGLMHDLFTRGVTPDGHLRPTREQTPDLYKESPLGWIPKEWAVVTTEGCAAKAPGSTTIGPFGSDLISSDYRSEGVPVAFVRDVKEGVFEWNSDVFVTHEKAQRLSAHAVRPGDLLSTKMGFPPCVTCEYPNWMEDGIITADIIRLRPDPARVNTRWLSAALNCDAFKSQVQAITAGVTRPKVTLSDFRKLRLARPGLDEQTMFAGRLASLADLSLSEETKLAKLHKQKHGLMHDLLTGRVRVKFSEKRETRG